MALKDNLNNLTILLQAMQEDHLSRKDFSDAIKTITTAVKKARDDMQKQAEGNRNDLTTDFTSKLDKALNDIDAIKNELQKDNQNTRDFSASDKRTVMRHIEQKLGELVIPPEFDDTALRSEIQAVKDAIPELPQMPEEFDATDIVEVIQEHEKEIEELKKRPMGTIGGGVTDMRIRQAFKTILNTEAPVGDIDGANTTYTVNNSIFAVVDFSLNGEVIPELPNYTFAGNTITFTTALPAAYSGKDFEIKYIG
jgi:BMFP domain-containing protein YqiC